MNLPLLDITILVIIIGSAIWGIFRGFVSQIVSIFALLAGIWCAFKFSGYLSGHLKKLIDLSAAQSTLHILTFIIILILVLILGYFVGKALEGVVKLSMLEWLNRLLGFIFAGLKTLIILSVIIYIFNYLNNIWDLIPKESLSASKGYQILTDLSVKLFPYMQGILK